MIWCDVGANPIKLRVSLEGVHCALGKIYKYLFRIFGVWVICVVRRSQNTTISSLAAAIFQNLLFHFYKTSLIGTLRMLEFFQCHLSTMLKCYELFAY
jgi:hypothetical protein